ncbi:MAG: hypothetical protein K1Y36_19685 [Blastocatellia bacterium]|nr:hypothetical protein [Blastocatellia bacterium]
MLNINRVILYKHGIGYFERAGSIEGDRAVDLFFRTSEVSDVLKSLTVIDLDGGEIASVSYDSIKPLDELLRDISLSVPDDNSLLGLLPQLKGAQVEIQCGGETLQAMIVGIDQTTSRSADGITTTPSITVLTSDGQLQSLSMREIRSITLLEERLRKELEYYLTMHLSSKKKDIKKFTVFTQGQGTRRLQVSYTLPMPVWKATYRIILEPNRESIIQGWAVVDNTQDEDWENVSLSLVSGLPISFIHDLYTARYLPRPVVAVQEETSLAPPMMEEPVYRQERATKEIYPGAAAAPAPAPAAESYATTGLAQEMSFGHQAKRRTAPQGISSVNVQTRERAVGDLFQYEITTPVTIKRNQSALVPIVFKKFKGRSVLLYNEQTRARNPLTCVEMENTTELTLEGGPVTVLEGDTYVGEAMLQTMKPEEKRLVPYSVELGVVAEAKMESRQERTHFVKIVNGTLEACYLDVRQKVYVFNNKVKAERTVYIEHPRDLGWELTSTPEPVETTPTYYRFKAKLEPDSTARFTVHEKQERSHYYQLRNITSDELEFYIGQRYVNRQAAETLQKVLELKQQINDLDLDLGRAEVESRDIETDQKRIRENLQSLKEGRGEQELRTRLVEKLLSQEERLEQLQKSISLQRAERITLHEKINSLIADIRMEINLNQD